MVPDIIKDQKALFRNILGSFIFDISFVYLIVILISLFIPGFYMGIYGGSISFDPFLKLFIVFLIVYLSVGLFLSKTLGMKIFNIYFSLKNFEFLNIKTIKFSTNENYKKPGFVKYFFVFILDLFFNFLFIVLFLIVLYLGILTTSIPTGGFLIDASFGVFLPHLIFSVFLYYIFSISIYRGTPGMAISKIRVPSYLKTITIFIRIFILIFAVILFFLIAPYFV